MSVLGYALRFSSQGGAIPTLTEQFAWVYVINALGKGKNEARDRGLEKHLSIDLAVE